MAATTGAQALQAAATRGLDRLDAQLLLLHVLKRPHHDRAWLLSHENDPLENLIVPVFEQLCLRRAAGEPLAYLVGQKEFFGLNLQVDARVLVPRPDTETLVLWALELSPQWAPTQKIRVLDLGTGSGAIALALAHMWQGLGRPADIFAIDASADALHVAQTNCAQLGLDVQFSASNWFEKVSGHFHLIVSNPPYIAQADAHLPALRYEPLPALVSGLKGLDDIEQIIAQAPDYLNAQGWLLLEHGYDQAAAVSHLLTKRGFIHVQSRLDLAGIHRCTGGQWPNKAVTTGTTGTTG